ncbi:MAG: hypothetical protein JEY94_04410 [Melioribacteraceae bacterium]|nr:hypothetical protein [Melioribacteraceae bacterium]
MKKHFVVMGSYYDIQLSGNLILQCRNILEIYNREYFESNTDTKILYKSIPDLIVIMMNPGSSAPLDKNYIPKKYKVSELSSLSNNKLIPAKPDITQYQIMRLMLEKKWKHVRILNLSDIREPKSTLFIKTVEDCENKFGAFHSIFSGERKAEFKLAFKNFNENNLIIAGWGCDKSLEFLAVRVLGKIRGRKIVGLNCSDNENLYMHPSPTLQKHKEKWLNEIDQKLKPIK